MTKVACFWVFLSLAFPAGLAGCSRADSGSPDAPPSFDAADTVDASATADGPAQADATGTSTIADVRGMADGSVDVLLEDVYVTYVSLIGYNIQVEQAGPALFVYTVTAPTVAVGNRIDLHVTSLLTYNGKKEIDGSEVVANDSGSFDVVSNLAQTLSTGGGVAPAEQLESELVVVSGATITSGTALVYTIEYGSTPVSASFRASAWEALGLCVGSSFDALAVVDEDTGVYTIRNFYESDISNLTGSCL